MIVSIKGNTYMDYIWKMIIAIVTIPMALGLPMILCYLDYKHKKNKIELEKLKYQKQILELEKEKEITQIKLLEEENKKYDRIINGQEHTK
ncbi:MAG: hypothetical protein LBP19_00570 [Treponema sp.]|jgi:hypothetical protein|nr:hypothetical protein [Treponema sp.]